VEKAVLRKKNKALRKALSDEERENYSLEIANQTIGMDIWNFEYFHIFLPIERQREINTQYLLSILQGKDKHIILSRSNFDTMEMSHFLLTDSTKLIVNSQGIPEPVNGIEIAPHKINVVFLPLLAFDVKGNRIGYGKGFYDRFLAKCKPDVVKIGLSYFEPEQSIIPTKHTDIPMNYCISPKKLYSF
jgi:5-formyltetrahydrofolate cyclo-ligase